MSEERFDAIIVGAGPAGSACAYTLAKAGKSVLLLERGSRAGSKNVTGGRLYRYALDLLDPDLDATDALERVVTHEQLMLLDGDRAVNIEYADPAFSGEKPQSYTVLRARFDAWLADQVEEQGAFVATDIRVSDLVERDGQIAGVISDGDEVLADVVVAADGVNALLAQKAGIREDITPHHVGVGVKEIIELPASTIEDRFHVAPGEGSARMILGGSEGVKGGGFLYTNRETISLGCVFLPESLSENGTSIHELFQNMKVHPAILPLIEGGKTVEYGAHLVPEAGWKGVPDKLYRTGFLTVGDAAGFVINQGYTIRGIDLAIVSGIAAANAILGTDDPSAVGPAYLKQLETLGLKTAMQRAAGFAAIMDNPRLFSVYPALAADVFGQLFRIDGSEPDPVIRGVLGAVRQNTTLGALVKDGWQISRALK